MKMPELIDRISKLERAEPPGTLVVPPPELIAFSVRTTRELLNLKKSTLASMAGVSLSTVERVENAESVSPGVLDKIAVAFGLQPGYFTAPRPVDPRRASGFLERVAHTEAVRVRHLTTQIQVRELAQCHEFLVNAPGLDHLKAEIAAVMEWLDLGSFVLDPPSRLHKCDERGRRELYVDILGAVAKLEAKGVTVLAGVLKRPRHGITDWKLAVLNITSKKTDPGALKRTHIFVDVRAMDEPAQF